MHKIIKVETTAIKACVLCSLVLWKQRWLPFKCSATVHKYEGEKKGSGKRTVVAKICDAVNIYSTSNMKHDIKTTLTPILCACASVIFFFQLAENK